MELKRVLGKDNRQAMEEVVKHYGPDALVVSGHKVRDQFELVIAVDIEPDPALLNQPDETHLVDHIGAEVASPNSSDSGQFRKILHGTEAEPTPETNAQDALRASEIVALFKDELQTLKQELHETRKASAWHMQMSQPHGLNAWQQGIMDHAMPSRLKTLLVDTLQDNDDHTDSEARLHAVLSEGIEDITESPDELSGVHAFFGPTGAGKTTLIGKLARTASERFGGDQVAIISFNDQKLGAWNQMQLMSSQLGIGCYRALSGEALHTILRELDTHACVFIDTSGVEIESQLDTVQHNAPEALTHLVVSSEIARATANRLFQQTRAWDSVNISKLDESTDSWVVLDALISHADLRVWLDTQGASLNQPARLMNTPKWVADVISTIERPTQDSDESEDQKIEGRQTSDGVSTLDFLTGLRAHQSDRTGGDMHTATNL
jgi:flagellar biosynthesis protein FlhF